MRTGLLPGSAVTRLVFCIVDGMADTPSRCDRGQTPLMRAATPHMDHMARHGVAGLCHVTPPGASPGTDVGLPALLGLPDALRPQGRGALEALAAGYSPVPGTTVWRLNVLALDADGIIRDPAHQPAPAVDAYLTSIHPADMPLMDTPMAGTVCVSHTPTAQPVQATPTPAKQCTPAAPGTFTLLPLGGFRHLLQEVTPTPPPVLPAPPDLVGKPFDEALAHLQCAAPALAHWVQATRQRLASVAPPGPALALWPWSGAVMQPLPAFHTLYGHSAGMVAGVPLARGLGMAMQMETPLVPGATGDKHTDLAAKARAACDLLHRHRVVFVHVEAPDLCAHARDAHGKAHALEIIDRDLLGVMRNACPHVAFVVTCDHVTESATGLHGAAPVPWLLYAGPGTAPHQPPGKTINARTAPPSTFTAHTAEEEATDHNALSAQSFDERTVAGGPCMTSGQALLAHAIRILCTPAASRADN